MHIHHDRIVAVHRDTVNNDAYVRHERSLKIRAQHITNTSPDEPKGKIETMRILMDVGDHQLFKDILDNIDNATPAGITRRCVQKQKTETKPIGPYTNPNS